MPSEQYGLETRFGDFVLIDAWREIAGPKPVCTEPLRRGCYRVGLRAGYFTIAVVISMAFAWRSLMLVHLEGRLKLLIGSLPR
jgi:hypothetical protein